MRFNFGHCFVLRAIGATFCTALILQGAGCSNGGSDEQADGTRDATVGSSTTESREGDPMSDHHEIILGVWEDDYKGKRTLTVYDDGTARMVVEPSGLNAMFVGRLTFEETWSITDGHITMTVTGGEPAEQVKLICQMMGDSTRQKILELDSDRMHLLDENGKTKYEWRRVAHESRHE